jgi:uncharacterized protein YozE (UPF0346 family)
MSEKDDDSQYLFSRLEAYMGFIEEELKTVQNYPIVKKKKFLESFMVFYEGYLDVRNKLKDADEAFPASLHQKIMDNLKKIRKLAYEQDDYLYEMRTNLESFEDGLTEIFYLAYNDGKSLTGIDLDDDIKRSLSRKCNRFLSDLEKTVAQYEQDFKEKIPNDINEQVARIKKSLRKDFGIIVDELENLGPVEFEVIDADAILDQYQKVKKMRKSKKKEAEQAILERMYEIYNK